MLVSASHAHFSLGDYNEAAASFQRGLDIEPGNVSLTSALANAEARAKESEPPSDAQSTRSAEPDVGPGGDLGGAGGLAGMLNNPMMMQMAQQMMGNGGMERLMQNPAVANMVCHSSSGR